MRILFVRHGNPDYELDCLTELGHVQAEAAAERLSTEGIEAIFSSTCGRALETAEHTAKKVGLSVHPCDFIREIDWSSLDGQPIAENGSPWAYAENYVQNDKCLIDHEWQNDELFSRSKTIESSHKVAVGIDSWLAELGFKREGYYYRVGDVKYDTVAMFCHGGAFAAAFSHIFNLPIPFVLRCVPLHQAGVIEITLSGKPGETVSACLGKSYSVKHMTEKGIEVT